MNIQRTYVTARAISWIPLALTYARAFRNARLDERWIYGRCGLRRGMLTIIRSREPRTECGRDLGIDKTNRRTIFIRKIITKKHRAKTDITYTIAKGRWDNQSFGYALFWDNVRISRHALAALRSRHSSMTMRMSSIDRPRCPARPIAVDPQWLDLLMGWPRVKTS